MKHPIVSAAVIGMLRSVHWLLAQQQPVFRATATHVMTQGWLHIPIATSK